MRKPRGSLVAPHPLLPACRASLCRSAASGHLVRARAPLAPPPFSARFFPLARLELVWVFCRETLGGRRPVRRWPRPAPRVPREGAGPPCSRLRGLLARAETLLTGLRVREVGEKDQRTQGSGLRVFPFLNLVFLRQEGNQRSRLPRPHPLGCHFFFFAWCGGRPWVSYTKPSYCLPCLKCS